MRYLLLICLKEEKSGAGKFANNTRLKEWGINTNYTTICFLGGGGRIIQSFGNYGSNIHFCDDMKINAKGYEFLETTLAMKQR